MTNDSTEAEKLRAYSWADSVHSTARRDALPVDLFAVARRRHVIRAGFRLMVQRGVLVPVLGGFELFLRDLEPRELNIEAEESQGTLSPRQRFTFAHELAHTHFYKTSDGVPTTRRVEIIPPDVEEICDGAAGRILVPTNLLKRQINQELSGDYERIDADFVRAMAAKFRASHDVMINRLSAVDSRNVSARCILLVRIEYGQARIRACYMGVSLLSVLPTPKDYDSVVNWLPELPRDILERDGDGRWDVTRRGRPFDIKKISLGPSGDFLLEVSNSNRRTPASP